MTICDAVQRVDGLARDPRIGRVWITRGEGPDTRTLIVDWQEVTDGSFLLKTETLKEGIGGTSLYNEALGTVSESYMYDRVRGRDLPESERPKRPWQATAVTGKKPA